MSQVQNILPFSSGVADPFAEPQSASTVQDKQATHKEQGIHIRSQQRNGRKSLTTIQGLPAKYDAKKVTQYLRKKLACNGTVVHDPELGDVIQLQGDQRRISAELIIKKLVIDRDTITIHGF